MGFVNWVVDHLAGDQVIDLYFIISDLRDMLPFSSAEEAAHAIGNATGSYHVRGKQNGRRYDLTDMDSVRQLANDAGVPLGKLVK